MNRARYVFVTAEGHTYQPGSESIEPDIENLQVLGFGKGATSQEAFDDFLSTYHWLRGMAFCEAYCYRLAETPNDEQMFFAIPSKPV